VVGRAERLLERGAHEDHDGCVAPAPWLAGNEQAVEQLDPVLRAEDADVDETVVSDSVIRQRGSGGGAFMTFVTIG